MAPLRGRDEVLRLRESVDGVFARYDHLAVDRAELRSDHANYLCVCVTGYIEKAIAALVVEFARRQSTPSIVRHVESRMNRFQNPNVERLKQLVATFSEDWASALDEHLKQDGGTEALSSLVALRHRIAHGDRSTGLTYARVSEYYTRITQIVDFLADLMVPVER